MMDDAVVDTLVLAVNHRTQMDPSLLPVESQMDGHQTAKLVGP